MQDKLDIKHRKRVNLLKWNAQFSPEFIEYILDTYAEPGDVVYDPFMGSGTVLVESARKNLSVVGTELNPAAIMLSSIYIFCNLKARERQKYLETVKLRASKLPNGTSLDAEHVIGILGIKDEKNKYIKILLECLIVMLDIKKDYLINVTKLQTTLDKIDKVVSNLPYSSAYITIKSGDARNIALKDNCVNLVITSPPYINVFNYHQQYRQSTELLGHDVLNIAKSEIGANRKNRSNRFKTVVSYCYEIAETLSELTRVTQTDGKIVFVVGRQSKVLGVPFLNGEIVKSIASGCIGIETIEHHERKFKNRFGQIIYEDILVFKNNVSASSRLVSEIATDALKSAMVYTDKESTIKLLEETIEYVKNNYPHKPDAITDTTLRQAKDSACEQPPRSSNHEEGRRSALPLPSVG